MKILVVSSTALRTPPKSYGGLESVAYNSALYLYNHGYDITLASATLSGINYPFKTIELPLGKPPDYELPLNLITDDDIKSYDLIIDHSHSHKVGIRSNSLNVKSMCIYHDLIPSSLGCTSHYAVSKIHASYFESFTGKKAKVIYDMVDTSNINPDKKEPILLWIGRINKGLIQWINWIKSFKKEYKREIIPVIIGDDSITTGIDLYQMKNIKNLVEETGSIYYGLTDRKTLNYYLGKSVASYSAFLPGYTEVFGMWIVESISANSIPLAPHQETIKEILQGYFEQKGLPLPPFKLEDINLITKKALENPFNDLKEYAKRFSPEEVGKIYEEEIKVLMS
jgi:hypothetical protein